MTEVELKLRVVATDHPAEGVRRLVLTDAEGGDLPAWEPGAHVELTLGEGLVRQYSLCGDPADRSRWQIAVLRERHGRGGSAFVHDGLAADDVVSARGPRQQFAWEPSRSHLFLAGGIGITPLVPMLAAAEAAGVPWVLHYGGRSRASMAFADELAGRYGDAKVVVHPEDEEGLLDLGRIVGPPRDGLRVHACGPASMLAAVEQACASFPAGTLAVERFVAREDAAAPGGAFEVELTSDGRVLAVGTEESILDVLERAGVDILSSCREGTCGTCETDLVEGLVEHRDSILTPAEQEAMDVLFVCCSRAAAGCSRLVIDR
ncbi:PDR/VanB family oxidoreductase [Nocardioides acrostichi]|uniref:Oxidoreductase n=1 Tax=Nocardioides acrostichi TaxID=2784339 RepID=A0A930V162_9ACTN|nr:PDR/VanB family oxidoreductase [Nocardioides acrostichi]MBF4161329.1 oxidoreductase [Nocardioides acrostichi]